MSSVVAADAASPAKARLWAGRILTGLTIAFMLFDGLTKLALEPHVIQATAALGYPPASIQPIGAVILIITALYAWPRTAIWGALLMTGFLGGAVASQVRVEGPLFGSVLFGVYFALIAWGGLYLRSERLRALLRAGR